MNDTLDDKIRDKVSKFNLPKLTNRDQFEAITAEMADLYARKNADYGDSFTDSLDKHGVIAYIVRAEDKLNRLNALKDGSPMQVSEALRDSAIDLANYSAMLTMWLDKQEEN